MREKSVMIRVRQSTRDRLQAVLEQMQRAAGGRNKRKWFGWANGLRTLDQALVKLLDRHDGHQARNRKAAAAARELRRRKQALLADLEAAADYQAEQHQAENGKGAADGEA